MNFVLYLISSGTSIIGSGIQSIVIPIYILKVTGSGLEMSKAASIFSFLSLLIGPFGGVIADKFNRKNIMIISDFISFLIIMLMIFFDKSSNITAIVIMQCLLIIVGRAFSSASSAIFSQLQDGKNIESNNNIYSGLINFCNIFMPIIGLFLYGIVGLKGVFLINSITFLISGFLEIFIKYNPEKREKQFQKEERKNFRKIYIYKFLDDYKPVLKFLKLKKELIGISFYGLLLNFFFIPLLTIMIPYFILNSLKLQSVYVGYLESLFGGGMLLGNIIIAKFSKKIKFQTNIAKYISLELIFFIIFVNLNSVIPISYGQYIGGGLILMVGILFSFVNVPFMSYLHKEVNDDIKGRFFSIFSTLLQSITPLGIVMFGYLTNPKFNIKLIITMVSSIYIVFSCFYFYMTSLGKKYCKGKTTK